MGSKMRIVTRPDFDGVVCAALLKRSIDMTLPILWVEPNELKAGVVNIHKGDIIANLPYHPKCEMWFDHHVTNKPVNLQFKGSFDIAPSAAGLIYSYYNNQPESYKDLLYYTDKIDSANFTPDEIRYPENYPYIILSMTISGNVDTQEELDYLHFLTENLGEMDIKTLLAHPDVRKRYDRVVEENRIFAEYLHKHTTVEDNVAIIDFREYEKAPSGNRFLVYSLFPEAHVSVRIRKTEKDPIRMLVSVGHSVTNKKCNVNAGKLMSRYGGGGHRGAASCDLDIDTSEKPIEEIIETLRKNIPIE